MSDKLTREAIEKLRKVLCEYWERAGTPPERSKGMDDKQIIEAARLGDRVKNEFSLHDDRKDIGPHQCFGRVIACDDSDTDVVECPECGRQWVTTCKFDEEYS